MLKFDRAARMQRHHRRNRKHSGLNLVSLMDIFTILVFFLLVNAGDVEQLPSARDLTLPESTAEQPARETLVVTVTPHDILVQGRRVATLDEVLASSEPLIAPLVDALREHRERARRPQAEAALQEVTIMGDRELPYRLLRRVMASCTETGFERVSLAVNTRVAEPRLALADEV